MESLRALRSSISSRSQSRASKVGGVMGEHVSYV